MVADSKFGFYQNEPPRQPKRLPPRLNQGGELLSSKAEIEIHESDRFYRVAIAGKGFEPPFADRVARGLLQKIRARHTLNLFDVAVLADQNFDADNSLRAHSFCHRRIKSGSAVG